MSTQIRILYRFSLIIIVIAMMTLAGCGQATPPPAAPIPTAVASPTPNRMYRMLIIDSQTGEPYETVRNAMLNGLANYGYIEGENLVVTKYVIGNDKAKAIQILQDELGNNYDVIYANGTVITTAAKEVAWGNMQYTFVFAAVTDPVGVGVIDDFTSPPKANFTGVSYPVPVRARFHFIRTLMPNAKTFGLIYAEMPQSQSYRKWVEDLLASDPEFKDIQVIFRSVPLVTGNDGAQKMAESARQYVTELDSQVDAFLSPNDQMAASQYFAQMVYETATKPLVGILMNDVMKGWGATMSIYPSHAQEGAQTALMIKRIFEGEPISSVIPETPKEFGYAFDLKKTEQFGIQVPVDLIQLAGDNIVH